MSRKLGEVYLAGSGPGDPELLTIKTRKLIDIVDVVIYDHLVGDEILKLIPKNIERIDGGKSPGNHLLSQKEINSLLVMKAREGKKVLRLKCGDPYIFGRGGEEAEELSKEGIKFEVIPGVTSAIAAPAYAGIPLSHRDENSMILFITGHENPDKDDHIIDWKYISKFDGTIVIFMGVKNLEKNISKLIQYGMDKQNPIAVIENGTKKNQRIYIGTLETIVGIAKREKIISPSLFVIGKTVNLSSILGIQKVI